MRTYSRDGALLKGIRRRDGQASALVVEGERRDARGVGARLPQPFLVLAVPDVHHLRTSNTTESDRQSVRHVRVRPREP